MYYLLIDVKVMRYKLILLSMYNRTDEFEHMEIKQKCKLWDLYNYIIITISFCSPHKPEGAAKSTQHHKCTEQENLRRPSWSTVQKQESEWGEKSQGHPQPISDAHEVVLGENLLSQHSHDGEVEAAKELKHLKAQQHLQPV